MSFLKKLFGLGGADEGGGPSSAKPARTEEHKGFLISATPYREGGQYQLAGVITKEVGGVMKEHRFIRADKFSDMETAVDMAITKGRLIVDERGERMFD